MSLFRAWLWATAALLAGAIVWAFAPILVPLFGVFAALGGLVVAIVSAARAFERRRGPRLPPE
ncbi:MAG TPA: hypothetical protein VNZ50_05715 [Hyphomicrobiaceae bacterium]|nr:hypothetical protein [Hyphomicrobiaceae bacterium]